MDVKFTDCKICRKRADFITSVIFDCVVGIVDKYVQNIFICNNCGFIFTNSYIDYELISNYYRKVSKYEGDGFGKVDESKELMTKRQFAFISNSGISYETVLDIGASTGFNLKTFKDNGKKVSGVEPSARNKKTAKILYGIDLFNGMYNEFYKKNEDKKFDLIFMSHVLEHTFEPCEIIKKICSQNRKYLYVEVPSFEMQTSAEPFGCFFYEHVNHFTVNSLKYLLEMHGYSAVKISIEFNVANESPGYPVICSLWEKLGKRDCASVIFDSAFALQKYLECSLRGFDAIKEKIDNINDEKKIAVWGTGSHTSRLVGMTNLMDKNVVKFYDSDTKKHQFKFKGLDICPFDVRDIENGSVDTIIISTFCGEQSIFEYIKSFDVDVDIVGFYR